MFILVAMTLYEYAEKLSEILKLGDFSDISLNGIQIGAEDRPLKKVALAVDACYRTISSAIEEGADILVVHHGLFWGRPLAIDGDHRKRVKKALDGNLMLFAAHLPLDANVPYGNNAQMAYALGMQDFKPFGEYKGQAVGVSGTLPAPMTVYRIIKALGLNPEENRFIPGCQSDTIRRVAIVSGDGGGELMEAIGEGVDLLITGEVSHQWYHTAMEAGISVLAGGHYLTETFGVKALEKLTREELGLETVFIPMETGL